MWLGSVCRSVAIVAVAVDHTCSWLDLHFEVDVAAEHIFDDGGGDGGSSAIDGRIALRLGLWVGDQEAHALAEVHP